MFHQSQWSPLSISEVYFPLRYFSYCHLPVQASSLATGTMYVTHTCGLILPCPLVIPTVGPHHFSFLLSFLLGEMRGLERCILMEAKAHSCPIYLNPLWYFSFSIFQLSSSVLFAFFRLLPSGHIQYIRQPGYHSVSDQSTSHPSKISWSMFHLH